MKLILILFVSFIPFASVADQYCQDVPSGISHDSISNNFDGSVYYKTPQVFFGGNFVRLRYIEGFCELSGKKYINASVETFNQKVAGIKMNSKGSFENLVYDHYLIDWIVCK